MVPPVRLALPERLVVGYRRRERRVLGVDLGYALRLGDRRWALLGAGVLLGLLAKGTLFVPGYATDDYHLIDGTPNLRGPVTEGRFGAGLLILALDLLGMPASATPALFAALSLGIWSTFTSLLVRHWGLRQRGWGPVVVAALAALHPYGMEIHTYRTAMAPAALSIAFLTVLLLPARWTPGRLAAGTLSSLLSLSCYQLSLTYGVIIALLGGAILCCRLSRRRRPVRRRDGSLTETALRLARHRHGGFCVALIAGTLLYGLASSAFLWTGGWSAQARLGLMRFDGVPRRLREIADLLRYRLLASDPLLPWLAKLLLLLLLVLAVIAAVRLALATRRRALVSAAWALPLLAAAFACFPGFLWVLKYFYAPTRLLAPLALVWSGCLAIALVAGHRRHRPWSLCIATVGLVVFIGVDNRIFLDQWRLNRRDAQTATRILARLEESPHFAPTMLVLMSGTLPARVPTSDLGLNVSAFGRSWSRVPILNEISGYSLTATTNPALERLGKEHCRSAAPWPAPLSVHVARGLAIVCLQSE